MNRKMKMKLCLYMKANKFLTGKNKKQSELRGAASSYKTTTLTD